MKNVKPNTAQQGFTLIELSIVLVIIGLIVGGVLVGQDLIKAAQLRATVGQVEKYNTSVNTFRNKYNALPGDMAQAVAAANTFQVLTTAGQGMGDGNGLIEDGNAGAGGANKNTAAGENLLFWHHLAQANLADGGYGTSTAAALAAATGKPTGTPASLGESIPPAKLGKGQYFIVQSGSGYNWYALLPITGVAGGTYTLSGTPTGLSPLESQQMDGKVDDGLPNTGTVMATSMAVPVAPAATNAQTQAGSAAMPTKAGSATVATCTVGTGITSDTYNISATTGGNDPSCALIFRFN